MELLKSSFVVLVGWICSWTRADGWGMGREVDWEWSEKWIERTVCVPNRVTTWSVWRRVQLIEIYKRWWMDTGRPRVMTGETWPNCDSNPFTLGTQRSALLNVPSWYWWSLSTHHCSDVLITLQTHFRGHKCGGEMWYLFTKNLPNTWPVMNLSG